MVSVLRCRRITSKDKSSPQDETANVNFFYEDIVHEYKTYCPTKRKFTKIYHGKIRLAVEFENNNE